MKPLLVILTAYLLMITVLGKIAGLTAFAGLFWLFAVAFFDNLLGTRKTLAVVAVLTLWSMIDETVPWAVVMMRIMIGSLGSPSPDIQFQVYTSITVLAISGTFVCLLCWNLFQLHIVKYLVRRWRLKERCACGVKPL